MMCTVERPWIMWQNIQIRGKGCTQKTGMATYMNIHLHEYSEINVKDVVCRMEREGCNGDQIQLEREVLDSLKN